MFTDCKFGEITFKFSSEVEVDFQGCEFSGKIEFSYGSEYQFGNCIFGKDVRLCGILQKFLPTVSSEAKLLAWWDMPLTSLIVTSLQGEEIIKAVREGVPRQIPDVVVELIAELRGSHLEPARLVWAALASRFELSTENFLREWRFWHFVSKYRPCLKCFLFRISPLEIKILLAPVRFFVEYVNSFLFASSKYNFMQIGVF